MRQHQAIAGLLRESKAFLKSTNTMDTPRCRVLQPSITARSVQICSTADLPGLKPLYRPRRRWSRLRRSRFLNTAFSSFAAAHPMAMPRWLSRLVAPPFFGMETILEVRQ